MAAIVGRAAPSTAASGVVERDPELDLDLPAGDAYMVDDEAHELLALSEVELVDAGAGPSREVADPLAQPVVGGELAALRHQRVALVGERLVAGVDVPGAPLDFGELEEAGLVQVGEASPLGAVGLDLALHAGQLGLEQIVVGSRCYGGEGALAGEQHVGAQERGADVFEHEVIERVGPDVALRAASPLPQAGAGVVGAPVVAVDLALRADDLLAADRHVAGAAAHQPAQQPRLDVLGQPAGAPLGVVPADSLGSIEHRLIDDGRAGDGDPLLAWASALAGGTPAARPRSRHRLGLVEVQAADVGLVAQHPAHRRMPPLGLARRGRDLVGVEAADDAAYGEPAVHVVFEDAPHHGGFWLEDLEAGRAG